MTIFNINSDTTINENNVWFICIIQGAQKKRLFAVQQQKTKLVGSLNYFVDLFKVISGTSFNSSWHLLKISPFLIIPGTSFTYIGYLLKLLAPLAKVGTFYIIFVFVSWWGDFGGILGILGRGGAQQGCIFAYCGSGSAKLQISFLSQSTFCLPPPPRGIRKKVSSPIKQKTEITSLEQLECTYIFVK